MQTFTANKAKTHFGELLDLAQREPVVDDNYPGRLTTTILAG